MNLKKIIVMSGLSIISILVVLGIVFCGILFKAFTNSNKGGEYVAGSVSGLQLSLEGNEAIEVTGMSEELLNTVLDEFVGMYSKDGSTVVRPIVSRSNDNSFLLRFPENEDYDVFRYYINYLRYCRKGTKFQVKGWARLVNANDNPTDFATCNVMFFIPEQDTEYDVVYFVTEFGGVYKAPFYGNQNRIYVTTPDISCKYLPNPID